MRDVRERLVSCARSLHERGLTHGNTGNLSARSGERILVTPTGSCLGELEPDHLAVLDDTGGHVAGPEPSKELPVHLAMYRARPDDHAVIHLHSPYATAVSCLAGLDPDSVFPPLTAYTVLRLGDVALVGFLPPGDVRLGEAVAAVAGRHRAVLLANHGPVVSAPSLAAATDAIEELEATARLSLLLRNLDVRPLDAAEVAELRARRS